jgi:hypothetical protein
MSAGNRSERGDGGTRTGRLCPLSNTRRENGSRRRASEPQHPIPDQPVPAEVIAALKNLPAANEVKDK